MHTFPSATHVPSEPPFNLRVYYLSEASPCHQRDAVNKLTVHATVHPSDSSSGSQELARTLSILNTAHLRASHEGDFASRMPHPLRSYVKAKINLGTDPAF